MLMMYLLIFCRVVIGLVFLRAFLQKAQNIRLFVQTVARFDVLPPSLSGLAGLSVLGGEVAVVVLLMAGSSFTGLGFVLASLLLGLFSLAIVWVLIRDIRTPCNCFGTTDRQVSAVDVWRNAGLMVCALAGGAAYLTARQPADVSSVEQGLIWLVAAVFVTVWLQLGEILHLLRDG